MKKSAIHLLFLLLGVIPLLVWMFLDAGFLWYVYLKFDRGAKGPFPLIEHPHHQLRNKILLGVTLGWICVVLFHIWFTTFRTSVLVPRDSRRRQKSFCLFAAHIIVLMMTTLLVDSITWAGLRVRLSSKTEEFRSISASLREDWPKGICEVPGLGTVGPRALDPVNSFYVVNSSSLAGFTDEIGSTIWRSPADGLIMIMLCTFRWKTQMMNAVLCMKNDDVKPDRDWIREQEIDWDNRVRLAPDMYLVTFFKSE